MANNRDNRDRKELKRFGKRLRELRMAQKISQEELNFRAELSKNMVGMIERGEVNPTLMVLSTLANALKISKKSLMDYE